MTPSSGLGNTNSVRKNGGGWIADTDDTTVEFIDACFLNLPLTIKDFERVSYGPKFAFL